MSEPRTEAGRRLGVDVEQELGLQLKSAEMYRGWLATADALAAAIEAEARASLDVDVLARALRHVALADEALWLPRIAAAIARAYAAEETE